MVRFCRNPWSANETQEQRTEQGESQTRQPRQSYNDPFKRDAVKLLDQPGYTLANAAATLCVSQTTLSNWKKTILPKESADRAAENAQLLRQHKEVEMHLLCEGIVRSSLES